MKTRISVFLFLMVLVIATNNAIAATTCTGRILNPVTDVSWLGVFPISIGPVKVGSGSPGVVPPLICACPAPPPLFVRIGVGVGFYEPAMVAEVVRSPYCSPTFGGINLASSASNPGSKKDNRSFYHAHWMYYPLFEILEMVTDGLCMKSGGGIDIAYLTELDPMWMDDEVSFLINPEAALFSNMPLQLVCVADCAAATVGFPLDELFWCAGCNGAIYPMGGTTTDNVGGGFQTSLLITQRLIAKMHRMLMAWDTSSVASMCSDLPAPILPKRQYKTQVAFPLPRVDSTHSLGKTPSIHGTGQEYPVQGENWAHVIWRRVTCCMF